jgi:hypothetical protein
MAEELESLACVLAGDQVDFFEHAKSAQGDVFEIADGRGDEIQRWAANGCVAFGVGATRGVFVFAHAESLARNRQSSLELG